MGFSASCPRCSSRLDGGDEAWTCANHGPVDPLWRPETCDYESFAELVGQVGDLPTYLPWPMSPGWSICDFGWVGTGWGTTATMTTTTGVSDLDGEVELTVVAEDPGVGLGARCAGLKRTDPGSHVGRGPHDVRVRAGGRAVALWSAGDDDPDAPWDPWEGWGDDDELLARSVFAGEAEGRWLWLIIRPASAALLLRDEWLLADVTGFGPEAVEMPFGGPRPRW